MKPDLLRAVATNTCGNLNDAVVKVCVLHTIVVDTTLRVSSARNHQRGLVNQDITTMMVERCVSNRGHGKC